jgi:hypothetical protein
MGESHEYPFNPSTKIRFVLSEERIIKLKVFDVLGNEVATLIDGDELKPGKYEHTYDAAGLSSGVYFYTISAIGKGSSPPFVRTGKMLLLK